MENPHYLAIRPDLDDRSSLAVTAQRTPSRSDSAIRRRQAPADDPGHGDGPWLTDQLVDARALGSSGDGGESETFVPARRN